MKTKEEYFKAEMIKAHIRAEEREAKWRNEIMIEASAWDYKELLEKYIKCRLSRISYSGCNSLNWTVWNMIKEECRFCGLEYTQGKHDDCCDDCFEKNKGKTLEELENE